jgi:hypothetical protein
MRLARASPAIPAPQITTFMLTSAPRAIVLYD